MDMKRILVALCALGLGMGLTCGPAVAADTIKIGVPGAHSGELTTYGLPSLLATQLVVEEWNAHGGVLGKKIEVIAQDDQCKPEMATNAATKLVSDGVHVVMGHICSGATKAAMPIYTNARIVAMSPSATTPSLTQSGENPYFFRTIANDNDQAKLSSKFIAEVLKSKKVAILHDNGEYGKGFAETNKNLLEKLGGTEIVLFEAINPDAVDFSAAVRKMKRAGADVVIFGGYHPLASKLLQQMNRDRVRIPMVGPDGLKDESLIKMAGKAAEGVYSTYPSDTSRLPVYIKAREQHLKKHNAEPGPFFYNAYSAALALLTGIKNAGSTDTARIMDALHNNAVETPSGTLKFDRKGDPTGVGLSIYQVKEGKFVELEHKLVLD